MESSSRSSLGDELAGDRSVLGPRLARGPGLQGEGVLATDGEEMASASLHRDPLPAVTEARSDAVAERNVPGEAFDEPDELPERGKPPVRDRHRVGRPRCARGGAERRPEDVAPRLVAALDRAAPRRRQLEAAAVPSVEEPSEGGRRVDVRKAEPVDRPVEGDERDRPSVADHRVVADRRISVDPPHDQAFSPRTDREACSAWRFRESGQGT